MAGYETWLGRGFTRGTNRRDLKYCEVIQAGARYKVVHKGKAHYECYSLAEALEYAYFLDAFFKNKEEIIQQKERVKLL